MADILFSIIIPVYNLAEHIDNTLKALFETGLRNCEIIVIDDGSSDDTINHASNFFDRHDFTDYKILTQKNSGVSKARNVGIETANGEYLIFFDGDDSCDKDMINKSSEACADNPDMLFWRFNVVDDERKYISQKCFEKFVFSSNEFAHLLLEGACRIRIGSFAVKRRVVLDNNLTFTEGCSIGEDVEFMYKCILSSESIHVINDILYDYIKREGSAANTYDLRRFQAPYAIKRINEYALDGRVDGLSEFVKDNLKNGLLITHTMYSFDSCCKYIRGYRQFREFISIYFSRFADVEKFVKEALSDMKYEPNCFSKKRFKLFAFSRRLYAFVMFIK